MAERKTTSPKATKGEKSAPKKTARPSSSTAAVRKRTTTGKPAKSKAKPDHGSQDDSLYTKPDLRARLKTEIQSGDKGGRAGQWSARKSQLLAHEYEAQGGGYSGKKRGTQQKNLEHWTKEKWTTADGTKAIQGKKTARYLPKKAWEKLSPAEKKATDAKKRAASKKGEQFAANTEPAKRARKKATKKD